MNRKLMSGLCSVVATACTNSDVSGVMAATPMPPTLAAITVAPANATVPVGKWMTFAAAVNMPSGASKSVRWSSSDTTKATVSSTGMVMGVAQTPGVAICATSMHDATKCACASLEVVP